MTEFLKKQQVLDTLRKTAGVGKRAIDEVEALPTAQATQTERVNSNDSLDCISRQAAIDVLEIGKEILSRVLDDMDIVGIDREKYGWGLGLIESYIDDIKELPSAQPEQRWIPCSERLPNREEYIKNNGLFNVSDGNISYSEWFDIRDKQRFGEPVMSGFRVDYAVIAWMPLPEPYAERRED